MTMRFAPYLALALAGTAVLVGCSPPEPDRATPQPASPTPDAVVVIVEPPADGIEAGAAAFVIGEDRYDMPSACEHYAATDVSEEQIVFTAHSQGFGDTANGWNVGVSGAWYEDRASVGALVWVDDVAGPPDYTWHLGGGDNLGETVHSVTDLAGYVFVSGWFESRQDSEGVAVGDRVPGWFEAQC